MRKLSFVLIIPLLLVATACRRDRARETAPVEKATEVRAAVPAPPPIDRDLDDRFAFAAGIPVSSMPYASLQGEQAWKDFAAVTGKPWTEFEAGVLEPMRTWAASDLAEVREKTTTLFYPFGGPDLATAFTLFPEATTTVLMGLEPVGNLPDFGHASEKLREGFFTDLGTLASDFLKRGYFITMHMLDTYSQGNVDGALPVIGFFLKKGGYAVVDVKRLAPDDTGGWKETPYGPLTKRPRRPYGVKIDYLKPGDGALRSVYYFSCDVSNPTFWPGSPLHRFFEGLGNLTTFVKAGSYLLHWEDFSTMRQLILDRSLFVLQDDTAVPYRYFKSRGWEITLFGRYAAPVKDFSNVEQEDLRAAYADPHGGVKPLSFLFGYHWRTQVDNLLLAKRPRRPYKVPVIVD